VICPPRKKAWSKSCASIRNIDPLLNSRQKSSSCQKRKVFNQEQVARTLRAIEQNLAAEVNPNSLENNSLRLARARLLARSGKTEAAIRELQLLTSQPGNNLEATLTLVALYAADDRWESVEQIIPAIAPQPALRDVALYLQGRTAYARGRIGRAREKFEAALKEQPARANRLSPSLYFYRSLCLDALGRNKEAQADLNQALDAGFRPESTQEALETARALLRHAQTAPAITLLEALILNSLTNRAEAWALLGRAHRLAGSTALAISAFNESLSLDALQATTLALRAGLLRQINDLQGALADYEKACALEPENPALRYALGLCLLQLGAIPAAAEQLQTAAQELPQQSEISLLAALLQFTTKNHPKARKNLQRYFLNQPNPQATAQSLAYLLDLDLDPHTTTQAPSDFSRYCEGKLSRKALLDAAGSAHTPAAARRQIASIAFFMAHSSRALANPSAAKELLKIAAQSGANDQPEALCARWLLQQ
jgi:tetratricopeptide (TPR) repeat protein